MISKKRIPAGARILRDGLTRIFYLIEEDGGGASPVV